MLTWFAVALVGGAVAVGVGWVLRRVDELGRPRRFPWVSVALLLVVAVAAAVQRDAHTARLLGAGDAAAGALAAAYWRNVYPLMPDGYQSPDCRAGGPMDERLADAPWLAPARS